MERQWVLVTGASEGIGRAFAELAAGKGFDLILVARGREKLEEVASVVRGMGREAAVIAADLSVPAEVERAWGEASAGRRIGWLINNAGLGSHGKFANPDHWARERLSLDVNIDALTRLMKLALPHMEGAGGGRIINVASNAAFMPGPGMAVYHASKSYVLSLSQAVADEMRNRGVSVTALCPGPTQTAFFDSAGIGDLPVVKRIPMPTPDAVAQAGWDAAMDGKRVIVPGFINKVMAFSTRITPPGLLLAITRRFWARSK